MKLQYLSTNQGKKQIATLFITLSTQTYTYTTSGPFSDTSAALRAAT